MNLDFIEPITLYQVVPSSQGNGIWEVKEIELSTLQDALDLGRTACYLPEFNYSKFSYSDLFTDEYSALKEAYDRMCHFLISEWSAMEDVSEEEPEEVKEEGKVAVELDYGESKEYPVEYYFLAEDVKTGDTTYCIDDPEEFLLEFYEDLDVEVLQ